MKINTRNQTIGETIPSGEIIKGSKELRQYLTWKRNNKYYGKRFSIFGDSISTLEGYNPKDYSVFFQGDTCEKSGVYTMADTWWGKVIDFFGGELLVNNSWSGCQVTRLPDKDRDFPSGISEERTSGLHSNSVQPDVILIYMGINDWANGVRLRYTDYLGDEITPRWYSFEDSYQKMIQDICKNYPAAEIFFCTLNTTCMSSKPSFSFPLSYKGHNIEEYNQIIRKTHKNYRCKLIDLYRYMIPYDTIDGTHPTAVGMSTIAKMIIIGMDMEAGFHFVDYTNELTTSTDPKTNTVTSDVIDLNPFGPAIETSNGPAIWLWQTSTKKNLFFNKPLIHVGRDNGADIYLDNIYAARQQASFIFNGFEWRLIDHNSINGTWINETKLMPEKQYVLHPYDKIRFANSEVYVFDKMEKTEDDPETGTLPILQIDDNSILQEDNGTSETNLLTEQNIDGRYILGDKIQDQGIVTIYNANDLAGNQYIIKKIDKSSSRENPLIVLLCHEEQVLNKLQHPQIPKAIETCETEHHAYIVFKYTEGLTLEQILQQNKGKPMDHELVIHYAEQIANVLQYLHSQIPPIIHRNITSRNILVDAKGSIQMLDFGLAIEYDPEKKDEFCVGTRGYAAPEQYQGNTTPRSDIYALGMIMYHLITGVDPIKSPVIKKPISQLNPSLPKGLEYIIHKCTEDDPDRRYQSCSELIADLEHYKELPTNKGSLMHSLFIGKH